MKLRGDVTGAVLGLATIPMTLLSAGSLVAGAILAVGQYWAPLLTGLAVLSFCSILARPLEALVILIDDAAASALARSRWGTARAIAIASGAVPVVVILAAEVACLRLVLNANMHDGIGAWGGAQSPLVWLWGYGTATGPWTLFALRVGRFRRTLVSIRAYAGHVALWLFSVLALSLHAPIAVTAAAMLIPAALPFVIGLLLALADREAIANVRV